MNCEIREGDLFTCPEECCFAHCISGDYALGAGIAKEFSHRYDMKTKLKEQYPIAINMIGILDMHYW